MELKNLFKISTVAAALSLAACGGDINLDASSVNNSVDNSVEDSNNTTTTPPAPVVTENPCASYIDEVGVMQQGEVEDDINCRYDAQFVSSSNEILTNVAFDALPDGGAHIFNESLYIGENFTTLADAEAAGVNRGGDGPTLFIEAGATLAFQPARALVINRGSQIRASGTASAPITITSETDIDGQVTPEATQEWGGMVINGFGFTNACQYVAGWNFEPNIDNDNPLTLVDNTDCSIAVEGLIGNDESNFGGALPEDNSGVIDYLVLKHAGAALSPGNELNGITFGAVGSQTQISNLEIYSNVDDGIEFFGGGVDVSNYVAVYVQDDSIDIDDGYYGTITNALIVQGGGLDAAVGSRTGAHCIESDGASARNENTVFEEDYLSRGTINNMTCISSAKDRGTAGNGDGGAGVNFEEGHLISVNNSIVTTAYAGDDTAQNNNYCFQAEDDIDAVQLSSGLLSDVGGFTGNLFICPDATADNSRNPLVLSTDVAVFANEAEDIPLLQEQFDTALGRVSGDTGTFTGTGEMFLTDGGNLISTALVRADEGTTTNVLNGFLSVPVAEILVDGAALPADFVASDESIGSTFTVDSLGWTFGLLDGARSQALWFEDGQTPGAR